MIPLEFALSSFLAAEVEDSPASSSLGIAMLMLMLMLLEILKSRFLFGDAPTLRGVGHVLQLIFMILRTFKT